MPLPFVGLGLRLGARAASSVLPSGGGGPRGFQINVETDIKAAARQLKRVGERNVPLAVAQALTATAKHLQAVQKRSLGRYIDRPTPFTLKALGLEMARARDYGRGTMYSRVFVHKIQSKYLEYQVYGGTRAPKKRANIVPARRTRLNKYGNLPRGYIQKQIAREDTHTATINGTAGIWKRMKSGRLKLLVLFTGAANYTPRYPFFQISDRVVGRELPKQINKAVRRAINARSRGR